ncbi:MAG: DUF2341 domain-containing protein [Spirochaetales bacterium]|nr:DUF2341 domain-containing protein [Spirochaetales bacterium]
MRKPKGWIAVCWIISVILSQCVTPGKMRLEKTIPIYPKTPLDDYQIMVKLTPSIVNYAASRPDGGDIRFFDLAGNELGYWIEKWTRGGTSIIWVKVERAGTDKIIVKYGDPGAVSKSDGKAVFDPVTWETFKKNWQYSGIIPGRVSGWEDALTEFEYNTTGWTDVDVDTDYVPSCEDARWFVRREFFLAGGGTLSFTGAVDGDGVWSLIRSDEIYRKIGGDEADADGAGPYRLTSPPFSPENDFDRYIWAGRGQEGKGNEYLEILSVDTGLDTIYTRKYFASKEVVDEMMEQFHIRSLFPGDSDTLGVGKIPQGWKGWGGIENFRIQKEGDRYVIQSLYEGDVQKIRIPTIPFDDVFSLTVRFRTDMKAKHSFAVRADVGGLDFGVGISNSNEYYPFIGKKRGNAISIEAGKVVNFAFEKTDKKMLATINGETDVTSAPPKQGSLAYPDFLDLSVLDQTIFDIDLRMPDAGIPVSDHSLLLFEDFSKMREGASFSGWQGISNFKAMRDVGEIALVPYDEKEQSLGISNITIPADFSLTLETALSITEKTDVALKVVIGNIEFGIGSEGAGAYSVFIGEERKATELVSIGEKFRILFEKKGKETILSINDRKVIEGQLTKDFEKVSSVTIKTLNPAIYSIEIRKL